MDISRLLMLAMLMLSSMALFVFLQRLLVPTQKEENAVSDLVKDKRKEISVFDGLDPERNFLDKLDVFCLEKLGLKSKLENMHMLLGSPDRPNPLQILHFQQLGALCFGGFSIYVTGSLLGIIMAVPGFILPSVILKAKIKARQEEILGNFATFVDLSALIIESGLDYITAFDRIIRLTENKTALEQEVDKMLVEIQLGHTRRDALGRFAARTGLQDLRSFVGLIVQSDELGTSLVDLLRSFAADMRFRRMNKAEKLAAQASTKMLFPLFFFIFPPVFLLVLAPMAMDMVRSMGGGVK
ncbi:MAG: type II secretion system F family protein [Elusimicrobiaceae bacterium]|nr:type II secretion system F family protein [Elusimicrobiaceae bacterium]